MNGDKSMSEMHLKEPGFGYSAFGPFTKHLERVQKFNKTGTWKYLHRNELEKACFPHNAVYSDSKDLVKRTISDKILKERVYEIAKNCNYDRCQRALASMVYGFFAKKTGSVVKVNERLAEELQILITLKKSREEKYIRDLKTIFGSRFSWNGIIVFKQQKC